MRECFQITFLLQVKWEMMGGGDHRGNKIKEWMNSILNQVKSVTFAIVVPIKSGLYNF